MHLSDGVRDHMIQKAVSDDACIPCHETTEAWHGKRRRESVCRGFFDKYKTQPLQIAERLGFIEWTGAGESINNGKHNGKPERDK